MPSSTVEDYIKRLYTEQKKTPGELVPMGRLAEVMAVVPGTVTTMIKALSDSGLVEYEPRAGVRLTPQGERLALHVLRRHRLVELFLVRTLGLDWSEVHAEAETLEHAISEKVLERIDALLGFPDCDPHGSPIPTADGEVAPEHTFSLASAVEGQRYRIDRVCDAESEFLQFAERAGLVPGAHVRILRADLPADAVTVDVEGRGTSTMGLGAARRIFLSPV
ncbi:MAG: metal-dependent transcriptional regulator [Kiritimatiellae bacterium]|nr:metal-dependent transcriptional regulator [Kiritimatiellia bacterium]MDW8458262.1 metal-dependent transcriptional regulator [Verrucomicrobiota bacterium]